MSEQAPPAARFGFASESPQIDALLDALAQAQAKIGHAEKNAKNPHFKKNYADLSSVIDASRSILAEHGLCIIQRPDVIRDGVPVLRTRLGHKSGQWIESVTLVLGENGPQQYVAGITYAKRAGWAAMVGVAPEGEDDDGETAEGRGNAPAPAARPQPPERAPAGERREAPRQAQRAPAPAAARQSGGPLPEEFVPRFGQAKGRPIGEAADEQVQWLLDKTREDVRSPDKAKYRNANQANADTLAAVLQRREQHRTARRTGIQSPLDGTPWAAVLDEIDRSLPDSSLDVGEDPAGLVGGYDDYDDRGDDPDAY